MLNERSPIAIGSVVVAFDAVCPTRLDLLHRQYRRLCRALIDVDEWGQVDLMNLLLRYARTMLPRPVGDEVDSDVKLLLTSAETVLMSCNPAVRFCPQSYSF
jgi:AP-3 complex subunit beta